MDLGGPVTDDYTSPAEFTGTIHDVVVQLIGAEG